MKIPCFMVFIIGILFTGCLNTEGPLEIKGKVLDEITKVPIPFRKVIVEALVGTSEPTSSVDAGHFSTDSAGYFHYTLRKVRDAYFYDFCLAGDSDYAYNTRRLGLYEIKKDAMFLSFTMSKLADFIVTIERKSQKPSLDTLSVSWHSGGEEGRTLYPCKIENYGNLPDIAFRWIGGNVKSVIRTRAYADKKTVVTWELRRNGRKQEFFNTVICKRDVSNYVNFKY
jgi:hypothetical protein